MRMTSSNTLLGWSLIVCQLMKWPQTEPPPCLGLDHALPSKFAVARLSSSKVPMISSENVSMPQLVWWMTNHSLVPSSLCEITSERMASSVARPPALRITWASPSASPAYLAGSSRASMQVRMAKCRAGGMASLPFSPKFLAYWSLASRTASKDFVDMVFDPKHQVHRQYLDDEPEMSTE